MDTKQKERAYNNEWQQSGEETLNWEKKIAKPREIYYIKTRSAYYAMANKDGDDISVKNNHANEWNGWPRARKLVLKSLQWLVTGNW